MPTRASRDARLTARTANRHVLYQRAVQDPAGERRLIERVFRDAGRPRPMRLREDFCGTALMCADWVTSHPDRTALGLDLDGPTLTWGRLHNLAPIGEAKKRVRLLQRDVRRGPRRVADVVVAHNFSYCVFKRRHELLRYFENARSSLRPGGAFMLDAHGGYANGRVARERTRHRGFTYVWEQRPYDPIRGTCERFIHFEFPDGTRLRRAFAYDWRLWSLPELRELLADAGFARVEVLWETATASGRGTGVFLRRERAAEEASWIAYIVAWRS